jgi:hypothetical protein
MVDVSDLIQKLPTTPFAWRSWDCFSLVNWVRSEYGIQPIDADAIYQRYPTVETFSCENNALLHIVPTIGIQQQSVFHLNILLLQSISAEYCLGTLILDSNHQKWVALMGDHAHILPLDRVPAATLSMWQYLD